MINYRANVLLLLICSLTFPQLANARKSDGNSYVPVTGFAKSFVGHQLISHAHVDVFNTKRQLFTDKNGRFMFYAKPGEKITLVLTKKSYWPWANFQRTQTGTFIVPSNGFHGLHRELTFQVPEQITYNLLREIIKLRRNVVINPNACQVAATITAENKTLADDLQGEAGAQVIVSHHGKVLKNITTIYFGILFNKTNPFSLLGNSTSQDGGVVILNLPASDELYKISAKKPDTHFTSKYFYCRPGAFINLSPPHGVSVVSKVSRNDSREGELQYLVAR
jgi:hypothetical protein